MRRCLKAATLGAVAGSFGLGLFPAAAQSQKVGDPPESNNMNLLGHVDLQARSAYQPTIHKHGNRYIAYVGHHGGSQETPKPVNSMTGQAEFNGTSIIDVTDPKQPKYLAHVPGEEGFAESGGAQMVRICSGSDLPKGDRNAFYMLRTFGNSAQEIWNVTDPSKPTLITRLDGLAGTHKNWWECNTGIAYLVSGVKGWRTRRMTQIYDLSDPTKPVKIRDFGLPGQEPGATGETPTDLHGPIPYGNRVYFGYGTARGGIIQIVDREKLLNGPKEPTAENLLYPEIGRLVMSPLSGAHTTYPLMKMPVPEFSKFKDGAVRDFIMVVNESTSNECQEASQFVWFADVTVENKPQMVSHYMVPGADKFCERGGRFGAHSSNESFAPVFFKKLAAIAWFNAGVRILDIRDPMNPKEVAYFIPAITEKTEKRCIKVDGQDRCKTAIQTNNVETDDRGYVYIVDRANTGMHILELTGEPRRFASAN